MSDFILGIAIGWAFCLTCTLMDRYFGVGMFYKRKK